MPTSWQLQLQEITLIDRFCIRSWNQARLIQKCADFRLEKSILGIIMKLAGNLRSLPAIFNFLTKA